MAISGAMSTNVERVRPTLARFRPSLCEVAPNLPSSADAGGIRQSDKRDRQHALPAIRPPDRPSDNPINRTPDRPERRPARRTERTTARPTDGPADRPTADGPTTRPTDRSTARPKLAPQEWTACCRTRRNACTHFQREIVQLCGTLHFWQLAIAHDQAACGSHPCTTG